ncbi:MAG: DUF1569 domain-containing protein [Phycisphaeraceae bacterium]|nr:DUF1569 domain-containing protein [Phycisphaeraceae bacterium]MCW5768248.1 DUF1569 domain-containing protein [Phycisphaeraceae bacterium]
MTSTGSENADSKNHAPCRELSLRTLDDLEREIAAVEAADRAGTLQTCGNWSAGKVLGHIAAWIDYAFDGYPMNPPWFVRIIGRTMKGPMLKQPRMKPGFRIRGAPEGTYGVTEMSVPEGAKRLRNAIARFKIEQPGPNPIFGPLTKDQWTRMHLNHASLHLGFLRV